MSGKKESSQRNRWRGAIWGLAISAQGGVLVALPVIGGMALGYWLDMQFGTLPWIVLVLTIIGAGIGPIILIQWVRRVVKQRRESTQEEENS